MAKQIFDNHFILFNEDSALLGILLPNTTVPLESYLDALDAVEELVLLGVRPDQSVLALVKEAVSTGKTCRYIWGLPNFCGQSPLTKEEFRIAKTISRLLPNGIIDTESTYRYVQVDEFRTNTPKLVLINPEYKAFLSFCKGIGLTYNEVEIDLCHIYGKNIHYGKLSPQGKYLLHHWRHNLPQLLFTKEKGFEQLIATLEHSFVYLQSDTHAQRNCFHRARKQWSKTATQLRCLPRQQQRFKKVVFNQYLLPTEQAPLPTEVFRIHGNNVLGTIITYGSRSTLLIHQGGTADLRRLSVQQFPTTMGLQAHEIGIRTKDIPKALEEIATTMGKDLHAHGAALHR